jgi:branched-chain amino acid aminotransferase
MPAISIDGEVVEPERAVISVLDRGLLYGDGVFEVLRTWNGRVHPAELAAHLARLAAACATLGLRVPARAVLAGRVTAAVAAAGEPEARIRIVVTRGPGTLAQRLATLGPGHTIIIVEPMPPQPRELSLAVVDWPLPARRGAGVKALAYLDHIIARELAAVAGADEALRLDAHGRIAECATANVFVARDGRLATPPVDAGVLPGIVRAYVVAQGGCDERPIERAELAAAEEVFVTSSLRGIVPVTRIDDREIRSGPIAARLSASYRAERGV